MLPTPQAAQKFMADLQAHMDAASSRGLKVTFDDFDISQNPIPYEQWDALFTTLSKMGARITRARLFGCPTLDDRVMQLLAGWVAGADVSTYPVELHLSDCAFTTEGFVALMEALERNAAIPAKTPKNISGAPIYCRLENNYIAPEAIQQRVDKGSAMTFQKGPGMHQIGAGSGAKIKILVRETGSYAQRTGRPPLPHQAAPPKPVHDFGRSPQHQGVHVLPPWMAHAAMGQPMQTGVVWPPPGLAFAAVQAPKGGAATAPVAGAVPSPVAATAQASPPWQLNPATRGSAGTATDRSRSPVARMAATPVTPAPAPATQKTPLPPDWEEHWSDEYEIPYFWNAKTGDSAWERPTE